MSVVPNRSAFAVGFVAGLAALSLGGHAAHAQEGPVPYWASGWSSGFRGGQSADLGANELGANAYGNAAGFAGGGEPFSRYNFSNGWFVGSDRAGVGPGFNRFNQIGAFGGGSAFSYEGVKFGYDFKNAPVSVYAGFDTLKYNAGPGGPFAQFDSTTSNLSGYSAHAGVEFRPTSNLSLSLGASFQQSGPVEGNSLSLPGAPAIGLVPRR